MYDFKNFERKNVAVYKLQNERSAKEYGFNLCVGSKAWMMVLGEIRHTKDAYYIECNDGTRHQGGFPIGYAHDDEGKKYMIYLIAPGFFGIFKED